MEGKGNFYFTELFKAVLTHILSYLQTLNHQYVFVQEVWAGLLLVVTQRTKDGSHCVPITSAAFLLNGDNEPGFE